MTLSNSHRNQRGFALVMTLIFLMLLSLFLSTSLSTSQRAASYTAASVAVMQVRSSVLSGIDYAETQIRRYDFTDLLKGMNRVPDVDSVTARQLAFRNPFTRTAALQTDWNSLAYGSDDDGLLHDGTSVLNRSGLLLNRCKLFFKASNNADDPGGPFTDTDDTILGRILAVTPAPTPLFGLRSVRNLCEIVEIQFKRTTAFLGPSSIYCPAGKLRIDLAAGGMIRGRAEIATGAAVATGDLPAEITTAFPEQLDGNPSVLDLSSNIQSDVRLRWLTDRAFVAHWKSRIEDYATKNASQGSQAGVQWAPSGIDLSGDITLRGIIFAAGPVVLRQSARIEGLLVLIESASLQLSDSASISGTVTAVGKEESFQITLQDQSQIEYRPSLVREALHLLPLSRTKFRYITTEMEM